ncbi:hypothetical protein PsorP6_019580 [Peronosclerospora sorghi]|nr:hypothetical protein PsorP6_019580 [Peronosclerospora sorghi]
MHLFRGSTDLVPDNRRLGGSPSRLRSTASTTAMAAAQLLDPAYMMEYSLLTEPSHPTYPAEESTTATETTLPTAPPRLRRVSRDHKTDVLYW